MHPSNTYLLSRLEDSLQLRNRSDRRTARTLIRLTRASGVLDAVRRHELPYPRTLAVAKAIHAKLTESESGPEMPEVSDPGQVLDDNRGLPDLPHV